MHPNVESRLPRFQRGEAVRRTGGGVSGSNLKKSFPIPLSPRERACESASWGEGIPSLICTTVIECLRPRTSQFPDHSKFQA